MNDRALLNIHMQQLIRSRVGVICVSWWGQDSFTDRALPLLFQAAEEHDIQICFHIEPHLGADGRNAKTVRQSIVYLLDKYGKSSALYRAKTHGNRPVFYVYDSYLTPAAEWATILSPSGESTLRHTKYDSVVIGLWVKRNEKAFFLHGHFDGFYTYFASNALRTGQHSPIGKSCRSGHA